jgi:hypothetical protein
MSSLTNNPIDNWDPLRDRELIARLITQGNTPEQRALDRFLEVRFSEHAGEENARLVESTNKLVAATHRFGTVTWWLAGGTILLGLSAAIDVVLKIAKGAH